MQQLNFYKKKINGRQINNAMYSTHFLTNFFAPM
jgi:hypothetical protein